MFAGFLYGQLKRFLRGFLGVLNLWGFLEVFLGNSLRTFFGTPPGVSRDSYKDLAWILNTFHQSVGHDYFRNFFQHSFWNFTSFWDTQCRCSMECLSRWFSRGHPCTFARFPKCFRDWNGFSSFHYQWTIFLNSFLVEIVKYDFIHSKCKVIAKVFQKDEYHQICDACLS